MVRLMGEVINVAFGDNPPPDHGLYVFNPDTFLKDYMAERAETFKGYLTSFVVERQPLDLVVIGFGLDDQVDIMSSTDNEAALISALEVVLEDLKRNKK